MLNSLLVASAGAFGCTVISAGAAYVFAKVKFHCRECLFYLYIIVMLLPFQVTMLPTYITLRDLRLYDTHFALILPNVFSAFGAFLLTQIMKTVPDDTIEAARLESGSTFVILVRVILPQIRAGLLCLFTLMFTEIRNMVAEPLILMESPEKLPLAALTAGDVSPAGLTAAAVALIPPGLIYSFFCGEINEGLECCKMK